MLLVNIGVIFSLLYCYQLLSIQTTFSDSDNYLTMCKSESKDRFCSCSALIVTQNIYRFLPNFRYFYPVFGKTIENVVEMRPV